jgi:hypothetical protein
MDTIAYAGNSISENSVPADIWLALLSDDLARDIVTARRAVLLLLVWQESFLSKAGLMARTEARLGRGCFGKAAEATFRRDMHGLKAVIDSCGFGLKFSRRGGRGGYYIPGRPELAPELAEAIRAAISDVDPLQIEVARQLTPADRVQQVGRLSDGLRRMALRRLMAEQPGLTLRKAHQEVMHRYYQLGG